MVNVIFGLALVLIVLFVILSMVITHEVSKRGVKINFFWLRLYIIKYIHQYRKLTLEESGRVGPLFYPCIISVNLALILAIVGFILK